MCHTTAGILAILAIALSVFFSTGGLDQAATQPGLTGRVVTDASLVAAPIQEHEQPETAATLIIADGLIPPGSVLTVGDTIMFETGSVDTVTVALSESTERDIIFRIQRAPVPESFSPKGGSVIATYQRDEGAYSALSTAELASVRAATGSGWYVFTAERPSGAIVSAPFFLR